MLIIDSKKVYYFMIILIIVILIVFLALYYYEINYTKTINIPEIKYANTNDYDVKIVFFEIKENIINISGYVYDHLPELKKFDTCFIVKNNDNNKTYKLNTVMKRIEGVDDVIANRGITTKAHLTFLPKGNYDLFIKYNNNDENILIKTDINFELE